VTVVDEGRKEGRQSGESGTGESNAQAGARARDSVTPAEEAALNLVTERVLHPRAARARRVASRATKRARGIGAGAAKWATRRESLVHAQSATFHETWAQHRECAQHYQAALLRYPRYAWGAVHVTLIKPLTDGSQWVTFSPARTIVTGAVAAVIWFYS